MFDLLNSVVQTHWVWPALCCVVAMDALVQCLPSATMVILAGLTAASGRISLGWVVVVGLAAFIGDNLVYRLGERAAPGLLRRVRRGARSRRFYDWARQTTRQHPVAVIVLGRYMSGARLAVMLTVGALGVSRPRFRRIDAFAAALWSVTTTLTGFVGGKAFAGRPIAGMALAAGIGTVATILARLGMVRTSGTGMARTSGTGKAGTSGTGSRSTRAFINMEGKPEHAERRNRQSRQAGSLVPARAFRPVGVPQGIRPEPVADGFGGTQRYRIGEADGPAGTRGGRSGRR